MDINKILAYCQASREESERVGIMFKAVAEAMAPFRATVFSTYLEEDRDYFKRTVVLEIKNLPGVMLQHTWSRDDELDMFEFPTHFYWQIGNALGEQFRAIPRIEPEPHIELGEN